MTHNAGKGRAWRLPGGREVTSEERAEREGLEALDRGRDYCPKCNARGGQRCATPNGTDHAARRDYRLGWDSALRARKASRCPAHPDEPKACYLCL